MYERMALFAGKEADLLGVGYRAPRNARFVCRMTLKAPLSPDGDAQCV